MSLELPGQPIQESSLGERTNRLADLLDEARAIGFPPNPDQLDRLVDHLSKIGALRPPADSLFITNIGSQNPVSERHSRNAWVRRAPDDASGIVLGGLITLLDRHTHTEEEAAYYLDYASVTLLGLCYTPDRSPLFTRPVDLRVHLGAQALRAVHILQRSELASIANRLHPYSQAK